MTTIRQLRRLLACFVLLALVLSATALADRGDPKRKITKADQARAKAMAHTARSAGSSGASFG